MKKLVLALALTVATTTAAQAAKIVPYVDNKGNRVISVTGEMKKGDSKRLRSVIQSHRATDVILSSHGGLLSEGIFFNRVLDKHPEIGVHVLEGDQCLSACSIAFLGGHRQSMRGTLAFHNGGLINEGTKSKQLINTLSQQVGMYYSSIFVKSGYHQGLASIILHNTGTTKGGKWLVFKSKEELDRWFIGDPKTTPAAKFVEGFPNITDHEINSKLRRLN